MNIRVTLHDPAIRRTIEDAIERLLTMLDSLDADPDFEPVNDDEPSLGWPGHGTGAEALFEGDTADREVEDEHDEDTGDDEESGDNEPWLGRLECVEQGIGTYGSDSDLEGDDDRDWCGWSDDTSLPQSGPDWRDPSLRW